MAAAILCKEENTVLIFAGRIIIIIIIIYSKLLNNGAFISSHDVGLISHTSFFIQIQRFLTGFTSGVFFATKLNMSPACM